MPAAGVSESAALEEKLHLLRAQNQRFKGFRVQGLYRV